LPRHPFLGRERELSEVTALLACDQVRLLTLTGAGGTGKTRLAIQSAAALAENYPDGVWWLSLASLRDPELVLGEAERVLECRDSLSEHIGDKRLLLLFDNFEHVTAAAPALGDLLGASPNLKVLVTSREPLHLSGEREYPVPPLAHEDGVALFTARAEAVDPSFKPGHAVSEICRRLDELPLAIELAAARTKVLSVDQLLALVEARLPLLTGGPRDVPQRQRTLRATIEWSYQLLTANEQRLFARLAVFAGGCALDAAIQVCDADLDTLASLVEKSLLRHSRGRYWMLETIREYALELLEKHERDRLMRSLADHLLQLVDVEPYPQGVADPRLRRTLRDEADNFRGAVGWALTAPDASVHCNLQSRPGTPRPADCFRPSRSGGWTKGSKPKRRCLRRRERVPFMLPEASPTYSATSRSRSASLNRVSASSVSWAMIPLPSRRSLSWGTRPVIAATTSVPGLCVTRRSPWRSESRTSEVRIALYTR
jgi:predicted ATPase